MWVFASSATAATLGRDAAANVRAAAAPPAGARIVSRGGRCRTASVGSKVPSMPKPLGQVQVGLITPLSRGRVGVGHPTGGLADGQATCDREHDPHECNRPAVSEHTDGESVIGASSQVAAP